MNEFIESFFGERIILSVDNCFDISPYKIVSMFISIFSIIGNCYDFLKRVINWVNDLPVEIYDWIIDQMDHLFEFVGTVIQFSEDFREFIQGIFFGICGNKKKKFPLIIL
jgi:phage-related protein